MIGEALSWEEASEEYKRIYPNGKPKTLPMDLVFDTLARFKDKFYICSTEGTIHKIIEEK